MYEKEGWIIYKDENFPSVNYMLFNADGLSASECKRVQEGYYPRNNVAYYTTYETALKRLFREIAESKMVIKQ